MLDELLKRAKDHVKNGLLCPEYVPKLVEMVEEARNNLESMEEIFLTENYVGTRISQKARATLKRMNEIAGVK